MRLAIICPESRPVPAIRGGAVETLVDLLIQNNETQKAVDLAVYSVYDPDAEEKAQKQTQEVFYYIRPQHPLNQIFDWINRIAVKMHHHLFLNVYLHRVIRQISKQRYDWIIVENRPLFIRMLRKKLGNQTRIALHLHNDTLSHEKWYSARVISDCDRILCISDFINRRVRQAARNVRDREKACLLYNRIDPVLFCPQTRQEKDLPALLAEPCTTVLYYGRMISQKGVLELVQAFRLALDREPALHLTLIGKAQDPQYTAELKKALEKIPADHYTVLPPIDHHSLPVYLARADLVVLPSLWNEPFGLTIAESMSMEKPVIATSTGAIPELLAEDCGLLIKPGAQMINDLAQAILDLAKNQTLRRRISRNARRKIIDHFHARNYLADLLALLDE